MSKGSSIGGMQTQVNNSMYCKCGKETSKILKYSDGSEIAIHFTSKGTYWHIIDTSGNITRTFKRPDKWE